MAGLSATREKVFIGLVSVVVVAVIALTVNATVLKGRPLTGGVGTFPFVSYPMFSKARGPNARIVGVRFQFETASGAEVDAGPQWWERYGMQSHRYKRYLKKIQAAKGERGLKKLVKRMNKVHTDDPIVHAIATVHTVRMANKTHKQVGEPRVIEVTMSGGGK